MMNTCVVSVGQMREIEREANEKGTSYAEMMERAGMGLARIVHTRYGDFNPRVALGLVGSGNNGGDTLVALACLADWGWQVHACLFRPRPENDTLVHRVLDRGGMVSFLNRDLTDLGLTELVEKADVILDGVLGTGISLPLRPELEQALGVIACMPERPPVIAVDCPSGIDCDTGAAAGSVLPADLTVSMQAVKQGMLKFPAFEYLGEIEIVDLHLPDRLTAYDTIQTNLATKEDVHRNLPLRSKQANKGTFGTAMVVAGCTSFTGAAILAGEAAYRIGAGLVRMAIPENLHVVLAGQLPEATWVLLPHDLGVIREGAEEILLANLEKVKAILLGPGFGLESTTYHFLENLLAVSTQKNSSHRMGFLPVQSSMDGRNIQLPPLVIDADGLKHLSKIKDWPARLPPGSVLTPHPGEMSVLTGLPVEEIQAKREEIARKYASEWGHIVVLKGALSIVANPDGTQVIIPVATPALARAGTGDVLAGIITGLIAQGVEPFSAARMGAWVHGMAGIYAERYVGHSASVLARDVIAAIPSVLEEI